MKTTSKIGGFILFLMMSVFVGHRMSAPTLQATGRERYVALAWSPATEAASYNVYRNSGDGFTKLTSCTNMRLNDGRVIIGKTYTYEVAGVDESGVEGPRSNDSSATPQ